MGRTVMNAVLCVALAVGLPHLAFAQPTDDSVFFAAAPAPAPAVAYKGVSEGSNKKINVVISTLKDIQQSVIDEEKQETTMYNKYMQWCGTESAAITKELTETKTELANTKVLNEEQLSSIEMLTLTVKKNEKEIEETKDAVAQAVALRNDESEKYNEEMQLNTQSLRQIDLAIKHVGKVNKQGGFLQNGVLKKLQVNQPGESNYVLGIMKGLKDKLTKSRNAMKTTEADKVKMHNSFMETKGKSLKALTDSTTEKKIALAETTAKQAGTKRKIGKLTEKVNALTAEAAKTASTCQSTKHEWKVRQADRTKEKAALNEAIRYLTESSLEQLSLVQRTSEDRNDDASVVFSPSFLQTDSDSKVSDNAFYKAANAALTGEGNGLEGLLQKDTFNGVKAVVNKLIASHQDTQQEEKAKKEYCDKEIATKDDDKATTTDDLNAVKADIQKKTAESVQLSDEVKALYKSIDAIKKSLEAAGKIRKEEAGLFAASSKDRALALKVLSQAVQVLQDFYSKALLQQAQGADPKRANPPGKWTPISPRKEAGAFGAVSMVQNIADDIAKEQKDAVMEENQQKSAFETLLKDSRTKTDDAQQDITDRTVAKAKLGVQINTLKETLTQKTDDLAAIDKQLEALHKSCDELLKFYNKRTKARGFEIDQLRDTMDILSGSGIAQRTLIQEDDDSNGEQDAGDN